MSGTLGTWPSTLIPRSCDLDQRVNQRASAAPAGGSEQVYDGLNDRWVMTMEFAPRSHDEAQELEAFLESFRGMSETIDAWHFGRPTPRGTLSGSPQLASNVSQGAAILPIQTIAGRKVWQGDMLEVDGLLFRAQSTTTADGAGLLNLPITNRVRRALSSGAAVTYTQAKTTFRKLSHTPVRYDLGFAHPVTVVLGEYIAP